MQVIMWLVVAFIAGVIESVTVALVSIWFVVGAVIAAVLAALGVGIEIQALVFLLSSVFIMVVTAPICKKFRIAEKIPTNADRLIGCIGIVTEAVDPIKCTGEVKVKGQSWSVQARGDGFVAVDTKVRVEEIVGSHLVVSVVDEESEG